MEQQSIEEKIEELYPCQWTDEELAIMAKKYHVKHGPIYEWMMKNV